MPGPAAVIPLHGPGLTIMAAVDAFLAQADLADTTRGEYGKHLSRLAGRIGADRPLAVVTAGDLEAATTEPWGAGKPRTWNQRLAVVGSFLAFARRRGWAAGDLALSLDRRRVKVDRTRVPTFAELERFRAKPGIPLLVKVFTRLQYETAARATELLAADIADLDMENRRLRVTSKGGDVEWVYFQSGAARVLPRLLRDRSDGPLFVTAVRPGLARAPAHLAAATGGLASQAGPQSPSREAPPEASSACDNLRGHTPGQLLAGMVGQVEEPLLLQLAIAEQATRVRRLNRAGSAAAASTGAEPRWSAGGGTPTTPGPTRRYPASAGHQANYECVEGPPT